ncbi:nitrite reductase small subunit NirD [Uliginosibacterium aquaticum]|uniref:Nitrite reductase small subunit NirD n=1 Tax=Uliginosibacterium aquaticum TaxID=2731212 RepID=A0ABX2IJY5_9RHOO|nr:nitrite reductase small subunit NirD [Uliginosibacterium aquaticum]NSL57065.1 nitrite reductase small subunit NirD [Uliginosibacterium aquaticum]
MTNSTQQWTTVCAVSDILPDTGVCALINDQHIAIFRVGQAQFYAIDNIDPQSGASVLARGLVGSFGERIAVASPLYKNHIDLRSGECLENPAYSVRAHSVRVENDHVQIAVT